MTDTDIKTKIKRIAVDHFDRDGFHGATIRNIAAEAGCSLPMVYYYYKNKQELFHEIIKKDYFELLNRQAKRIRFSNILDYYTDFVYSIKSLSDYDKKIYRLGIKVYLTFDGDEELKALMDEWERSIIPRHLEIFEAHAVMDYNTEVAVRTLIHLMENLLESIVVKRRTLSKEAIREELELVLKNVQFKQ